MAGEFTAVAGMVDIVVAQQVLITQSAAVAQDAREFHSAESRSWGAFSTNDSSRACRSWSISAMGHFVGLWIKEPLV